VAAVLDAPSEDFSFAVAVAGFGMLLRDSEHRGTITSEQVLSLARDGRGQDPQGYRRGFIEMVQTYQRITLGTEERGEGIR
jgi:Ca-activated chloride channel family protein